ncbi:hypothetical protein F4777DRAFT_93121 [Nemania sp. FL0916]|nr:hypothetical protein F4777DRAFT_93121 [Nemania sp. FL0916]
MRASILTTAAALASSAIAAPLEARKTYAIWSAKNVTTEVSHIIVGATFNLDVPAGYIAGAPAFNVTCSVDILDQKTVPCTWNGPQAAGSTVETAFFVNEVDITVYHTFGSTTATGYSGDLEYNADFTLDVTSVVTA